MSKCIADKLIKVIQKKSDLEKGVSSPKKGHTIAQLERLKNDNWHNPDTGTEISAEEGQEHLDRMHNNQAQKKANKMISNIVRPKKPKPSNGTPEDWLGKAPFISEKYEDINWSYHPSSEGAYQSTIIHKPTGTRIHKYHMISEDGDHTGSIYAVTEDGHHKGKPIARVQIDHHDQETNQHSPKFAVALTDPAHRGKGLNTMIHNAALRDYGELGSDYRLSPGSQKTYEKLAQNPNVKVKMGNTTKPVQDKQGYTVYPQDSRHELKWAGTKKPRPKVATQAAQLDFFQAPKKLAASEKMTKMSRPALKFPGLSAPTRMDQDVRLLTNDKQKKIYGKVSTLDSKNPKEYSSNSKKVSNSLGNSTLGMSLPMEGQGPGKTQNAAVAGSLRSNFEHNPEKIKNIRDSNQKNIKYKNDLKSWKDNGKKLKSSGASDYDLEEHRKSAPKLPQKQKIPKNTITETSGLPKDKQIQRGRETESTVQHEAAHGLFNKIQASHGKEYVSNLQDHLLNAIPKDTLGHLTNFVKDRGYKPGHEGFKEELLTHARDLLVNPRTRDDFKSHIKAKEPAPNAGERHVSNLKSSWEEINKRAKAAKPGDKFDKSESAGKPASFEAEKKKAETAKTWKTINKYFPDKKPVQQEPSAKPLGKSVKSKFLGAVAGATMLASPMASAPNPTQADHFPQTKKQMHLKAIAEVESRNGKDTNHKKMTTGMNSGDAAVGKYGIMPITMKEIVRADPELRQKHGKISNMNGTQIKEYSQKYPDLEEKVASNYYDRLSGLAHGDFDHIGYGWLQGAGGMNRAIHQNKDVSKHWHVRKLNHSLKMINGQEQNNTQPVETVKQDIKKPL